MSSCVFMSSKKTVPCVSYLSTSSSSISIVSVQCLRIGMILNLSAYVRVFISLRICLIVRWRVVFTAQCICK